MSAFALGHWINADRKRPTPDPPGLNGKPYLECLLRDYLVQKLSVWKRPSFSRNATPRGQALNVSFRQEPTFKLWHGNDGFVPRSSHSDNCEAAWQLSAPIAAIQSDEARPRNLSFVRDARRDDRGRLTLDPRQRLVAKRTLSCQIDT